MAPHAVRISKLLSMAVERSGRSRRTYLTHLRIHEVVDGIDSKYSSNMPHPQDSKFDHGFINNRSEVVQKKLLRKFPELLALESLIAQSAGKARINVEAQVRTGEIEFPIYSLVIGAEDRTAPTLGIFSGVHGLERVGSEITIAYLQTILELMEWDESFRERLSRSRIVLLPIVNPVGIYLSRRSNGNGVDLMRNAPLDADSKPPFLVGGHRYSNSLPFFRGSSSSADDMEIEAKAVCAVVRRELHPSKFSLSVDVHSGFGTVDRFWFPYAKTRRQPPHLLEMVAVKRLFDRSYPNHFYRIEPQASQYTTHGDLWDWLYDEKIERQNGLYLPWTLELGSWAWLRKNPLQLFTKSGVFNPILPHRLRRILRRHLTLFDFLHRSVISHETWRVAAEHDRAELLNGARKLWYGDLSGN